MTLPPAGTTSPYLRDREERRCISHERQWNTQGKCAVLATEAVETHGKGAILAVKAVEMQGKVSVVAAKAVEPQGKGQCFGREGTTSPM